MIFKKKYVCIALGALMMSGLTFGKFGADSKIQEVKAEEQSIIWAFKDDGWQDGFRALGDSEQDIIATWDITVDGLNFYSTQKNRYSANYIQLGGSGSPTERVFTFTAEYPGTLEIAVSNTGPSDDFRKYICVQIEGDEDSLQEEAAGFGSPGGVCFDIESGVQKIYPSKALRLYQIKYTFELPTRTLEEIYIDGTATKLNYNAGEVFDPAGLKVMGKYDTGEDTEITTGIEWTFSPEVLTVDTKSVTITATTNGKTSDPFIVDNLVVNPKLSDLLNSVDFPTEKSNGWFSSDSNNVAYVNGNNLRFEKVADSTTFFPISLSSPLEYANGNYSYIDTGSYDCNCVFKMENNTLTSIEFSSNYRDTLNGNYLAPHMHSVYETHPAVEPTCLTAGHKVYYECDCGKYFSDEALTQEITNLDAWLAESGEGYIAPKGHSITKVPGVAATDTTDGFKDAYKCNACGKYFEDANGTKLIGDEVAYNAWKLGEGKIPALNPQGNKGLSGGAIAGITVGAVAGAVLISYAVMFAVYAKTGKGLKFLSKSFDWLKKLFKMK